MADVFASQPVKTKSGESVAVTLAIAPTTPVTGTFFQTTQPVSLATAPTTPVTGTFFQTTQPVSLATAPTTPVTGTFYQATQPVSGTFYQATQPVSLATNTPTLQTSANVIGSLVANQSVNTAQINGVTPAVGSGASNTGTQRVILASDQATIPVSQGLSFTTVDSGYLTSVALAAGATITLDGAQIASGIGKLFEASVSSSVALKAQLGTWDGTTFTVKRTFFVPANGTILYEPSRYDAITMATGATAKFRWSITNNDNTNAADVYASITHAI